MPVCYSEDLEKLEKRIGYSFKDKRLIIEALTHKSCYHENPARVSAYNERLEFLGDSVLGLVVVEFLFTCGRGLSESVMSKIKAYIVRGEVLSQVAGAISLGRYLRLGRGEEETGGRRKKNILADALEAVLGAVYSDCGYEKAREIVLDLFRDRILQVIASGQYHDYKTELQEKSQQGKGILPEYRVTAQEGEEHRKTFTVNVFISGERYGSGIGKSKKEAQTAAAKEALEKIAVT